MIMHLETWQKAEAAAQKKAAEDAKRSAEEDKQWAKGAKSNAKKWVFSFSLPDVRGVSSFFFNIDTNYFVSKQ